MGNVTASGISSTHTYYEMSRNWTIRTQGWETRPMTNPNESRRARNAFRSAFVPRSSPAPPSAPLETAILVLALLRISERRVFLRRHGPRLLPRRTNLGTHDPLAHDTSRDGSDVALCLGDRCQAPLLATCCAIDTRRRCSPVRVLQHLSAFSN